MGKENLEKAYRKHKIAFVILLVLEVLMGVFFYMFVKAQLATELGTEEIKRVAIYVGVAVTIAVVAGDIYYVLHNLGGTKALMSATVIHGVIDDFIVSNEEKDSRTIQVVNIAVRETGTGKRYYTYGRYNHSWYTAVVYSEGRNVSDIAVYREDHTKAKIGDSVTVYMIQPLDINVSTDEKHHALYLNGKRHRYIHYTNHYEPQNFQSVTFYKGAVDVL